MLDRKFVQFGNVEPTVRLLTKKRRSTITKGNHHKLPIHDPICSMELEYLPTFTIHLSHSCSYEVTIPVSMEHSGIPIVFLADHPNLAYLSVPSYHLGIGKPFTCWKKTTHFQSKSLKVSHLTFVFLQPFLFLYNMATLRSLAES